MSTRLALTGPLIQAMQPRREYFGGRLNFSLRAAGLTFSDVEYDEPRQCRRHTHGKAFFAVQLCGGYSERFRSFRLDYRPFDVGFHPEGTEHADEVLAARTRFLLIEMERSWWQELQESSPTALLEPRQSNGPTSWLALRLWQALRDQEPGLQLTAQTLVLEMLGRTLRKARRSERNRPPWVNAIVDLLKTDSADSPTIRDLARAVDRHPVYVSRAFRHFCGVGIGEYRLRIRIQAAMRDLSDDHFALADVALRAGLSDQSRLTRVVKRATGMTPGQLRALARGRDRRI